jgi:hypothetical protein
MAMRIGRAGRIGFLLVGLLTLNWPARAQYARDATSSGNFAGRWVLVGAKPLRPGYEQFWMGTEATVTQTPETIEILQVAPTPERRARFVLGKETQNQYVVTGQKVQRDSRATLRDGLLLISTDTTTDTEPRRRTNIMRWAIEADGMLAITDTEMCGKGECPSIITNLRFKRQ